MVERALDHEHLGPARGIPNTDQRCRLPDLVTQLEKVFADTGTGDAPIRVNMTGCPNGCARPYNAEIGIVGRTKTTYDVYVGGQYVGSDPDPNIRAQLQRRQPGGQW